MFGKKDEKKPDAGDKGAGDEGADNTSKNDVKNAETKAGLVTVKFLKKFGSYAKDEEVEYHTSTINPLIKNGTCEIVK